MTTIHLGDCLNGCETCYDNYHSGFENIECDQCGKFIEPTAPQCGACGEYGNHICTVEADYLADTACEICGNYTKENHATTDFWNWVCVECWNKEKDLI